MAAYDNVPTSSSRVRLDDSTTALLHRLAHQPHDLETPTTPPPHTPHTHDDDFLPPVGHTDADHLELTLRACLFGALFAAINGVVNMIFAFRFAGGLAQYWVILVAYPLCKATETLPRGSLLNPGPFGPKEHCLVMTMAIAGSLAGTLGLSGGMLSLSLSFDTRLSTAQIFLWAAVAGFFGLFFGANLFETLVVPRKYTWPFARANAAFISTFYSGIREDGGASSMRVFGAFFAVAFSWFSVPNHFVPFLLTLPVLCAGTQDWAPVQPFGRSFAGDATGAVSAVLGSGVAGAGFPGIGGWATCWSFGPSIVPLRVSVQIFISVVVFNWLFIPKAFWDGLVAWPSSFREFDSTGAIYPAGEGHHSRTGDPVFLSGVGMTMYFGVALSVVAMFTDVAITIVWPAIKDAKSLFAGVSGRARIRSSTAAPAINAPPTIERPLSLRLGVLATAVFSVATVCVIELALPRYKGESGLGMPAWGTCFFILYAFVSSIGSAVVYATTGQNFSGGASILGQILCGWLVPGSARANVIAVMIVSTSASQAMGVLTDLKTALYLRVSPRAMFIAQLFGAAIGVTASASAYCFMLSLNDAGVITLGTGAWPAVGAESQTLNAKLFGEQGIAAVLHGELLGVDITYWVGGCAVFGLVGMCLLHAVPDNRWWKPYLPDPMLLGMAGLYSGLSFSATSLLVVAIIYQRVLRNYAPAWLSRNQYVSTAGVNAGVGIAGILVIIFATVGAPAVFLGPSPEPGTCNATLPLPARDAHDVACWNAINGGEGCNTPWPST